MNVILTSEQRFDRTPDGSVWTPAQFAYSFWTRYLDVFDSVRVVARVRDAQTVPSEWKQATGERVSFAPIPYFVGPSQYLMRYFSVGKAARAAVKQEDAVILRVPS